jgi:hypothetical protein
VRLFQAERAWEVYSFVVMLVIEVAMVISFLSLIEARGGLIRFHGITLGTFILLELDFFPQRY